MPTNLLATGALAAAALFASLAPDRAEEVRTQALDRDPVVTHLAPKLPRGVCPLGRATSECTRIRALITFVGYDSLARGSRAN